TETSSRAGFPHRRYPVPRLGETKTWLLRSPFARRCRTETYSRYFPELERCRVGQLGCTRKEPRHNSAAGPILAPPCNLAGFRRWSRRGLQRDGTKREPGHSPVSRQGLTGRNNRPPLLHQKDSGRPPCDTKRKLACNHDGRRGQLRIQPPDGTVRARSPDLRRDGSS